MKRKLFVVGILAALILSGCVGTKSLGVLDPSIPEDIQCPLEIRNNLVVILYDNMPVDWFPDFSQNKVTITLPPGQHSFMVKWTTSSSSGYYTTTYTHTETINQEFLAGHSYRIYKQNIWLIFFTITNIKIKDVTPKGTA
jgi:hypothetical protein